MSALDHTALVLRDLAQAGGGKEKEEKDGKKRKEEEK